MADATNNTRPGARMCCKWYTVPLEYPQNVDGQLKNDQGFCTKLQEDLKNFPLGCNESHRGRQTVTRRY